MLLDEIIKGTLKTPADQKLAVFHYQELTKKWNDTIDRLEKKHGKEKLRGVKREPLDVAFISPLYLAFIKKLVDYKGMKHLYNRIDSYMDFEVENVDVLIEEVATSLNSFIYALIMEMFPYSKEAQLLKTTIFN